MKYILITTRGLPLPVFSIVSRLLLVRQGGREVWMCLIAICNPTAMSSNTWMHEGTFPHAFNTMSYVLPGQQHCQPEHTGRDLRSYSQSCQRIHFFVDHPRKGHSIEQWVNPITLYWGHTHQWRKVHLGDIGFRVYNLIDLQCQSWQLPCNWDSQLGHPSWIVHLQPLPSQEQQVRAVEQNTHWVEINNHHLDHSLVWYVPSPGSLPMNSSGMWT